MKLLKTSDELISHMKIKGIQFSIVKEDDAKIFLQNNNYYMKLASYRANYDKRKSNGEYINLDFAKEALKNITPPKGKNSELTSIISLLFTRNIIGR